MRALEALGTMERGIAHLKPYGLDEKYLNETRGLEYLNRNIDVRYDEHTQAITSIAAAADELAKVEQQFHHADVGEPLRAALASADLLVSDIAKPSKLDLPHVSVFGSDLFGNIREARNAVLQHLRGGIPAR